VDCSEQDDVCNVGVCDEGEDLCVKDPEPREGDFCAASTCSDSGNGSGGGTCTVTDFTCESGSCQGDETRSTDTCGGNADSPSVTWYHCSADDTCVSNETRENDSCSYDGGAYGGGTCSATDWACSGSPGRLSSSSSGGVDSCSDDGDTVTLTTFSCGRADGVVTDTCQQRAPQTFEDSCDASGDSLGGGSCSATDWRCDGELGRLLSSVSNGTDTCGGTADEPSVTFYGCRASEGSSGDTCVSDATNRSDSCSDGGDFLGGGSCSATDWRCADGLLSKTDSIGLDSCVDGQTTFFSCDASDGSIDDRCVADTTLCSMLDETCADGLCDPGGKLCEAVNRTAGDPCRGGNPADTVCTDPDTCDGEGVCLPNNEPCAFVTDSSLCFFDVQPDKGMCTVSGEACLFDFAACGTDSGTLCADGSCKNADGEDIGSACTDGCVDNPGGDYCEQTGQFRLLYTPDVKNFPAYKLPASNPGQTFYNLIVDERSDVSITIPYPYVTVGGMPLHVYDDDTVVGACLDSSGSSTGLPCSTDGDCNGGTCDTSCFAPADALRAFDAQWTIEDWIAGNTRGGDGWTVLCRSVCGPAGAGTCTLSFNVGPTPSDKAYVNLHLDYGLKGVHLDANPCDGVCDDGRTPCTTDLECAGIGGGTCNFVDRYDQGLSSGTQFAEVGFDALVNSDTQDGPVGIHDCTNYEFSHVDPYLGNISDSLQNLNVFKPIAGSFGRCTHENSGNPCNEGLVVELTRNGSGEVVKTGLTDQDGFWVTPYKHKGKPALYTVVMYEPGCTLIGQEIELQGNGWANVDFDASTCTSTAEYGKGRNKKE
jgi:hypothetical protein